ncbi:hypothetical protein BT63DRAFT_371706 [Microthyrium microscopicum]|uniref:Zn(2)-C6 fungal-type domain-containing protein n=1 Tax=Microthyrium microscopicum TaxID=703497 RepID=A0A6A6UD61_9PEZI|nr:hypothetical protein BT63DRAFT_371706 [Microthyrium microscopicum]
MSHTHTPTANPNSPSKFVIFNLLLQDELQNRVLAGRLPMRVNIQTHDSTESIITTAKNFWGLYDSSSLVFEDKSGNTMIARYENFEDNMTVYVRSVGDVNGQSATPPITNSPRRPRLQAPFDPQSFHSNGHSISRPSSRTAKKRSTSPQSIAGHRSNSVSTVKSRQKKSRMGSVQGDGEYDSDSDGGNASITSSRRGKIDVVASAEISVDNIVEGGRRKRARFDSSELPLFVPSQVPMTTSISSVSPQRRTGPPGAAASPFQPSNQQTFSYSLVPSPQSFSHPDSGYRTATYSTSGSNYNSGGNGNRRYIGHRQSISGPAGGIFPTPDPTVGSVISDEDVALQLMRLGDANYSTHGRTSTSTLDDGFSGKADASSAEESDDGNGPDGELPEGHFHSDESEDDYEDRGDGSFKGESDGLLPEDYLKLKKSKSGKHKVGKWKVSKSGTQPLSPSAMAMPGQLQRKNSASSLSFQHFQQPLGEDEEDLSTKPRCQRCRKSKKGCDRQRPCGRCRDAGIGADGCVSEDEGNGRKGRYGRHMGVPVKKGADDTPYASIEAASPQTIMSAPLSMAPPPPIGDKSKKRKR